MKTGVELIAEERARQVSEEGFDANHDAGYKGDELEEYAKFLLSGNPHYFPTGWDQKWMEKRFKRSHKENLIKAGALIAAQLDILNKE